MWVRGLKLLTAIAIFYTLESHPMWVRGLKQINNKNKDLWKSRTPCGCVD